MGRAAHLRTPSPLRVPGSHGRLVGALAHSFFSITAPLLSHVACWLCCPGGWASPVWRVPGERMSSLLWLLQRAEAHLRLASLQRGKPHSERDTDCFELRRHREQGGGKARRGEEIFHGVFRQPFPLFLILQFKGKTHIRRPSTSGAVSLPCKCTLCSSKHRRYYPFGYYWY